MKELTYDNTPETMSIDEAVELFQPLEDGTIHDSKTLMNRVVPKEYLDNEEFFKKIIPTRRAITYRPLIAYGSHKIKANEELVMMSIMQNGGSISGLDKHYRLPLKDDEKKELQENKQYIVTYKKAKFVVVKSKLLEDEQFIKKLVSKLMGKDYCQYLAFSGLAEHSKIFASNDEYMKLAVSVNPSLFILYKGENIKEIIIKAVKTMLETGNFGFYANKSFVEKQDESVKKLINLCGKIGDLPENAKIRTAIYKKICKHYLSSLEKENKNEEGLTE